MDRKMTYWKKTSKEDSSQWRVKDITSPKEELENSRSRLLRRNKIPINKRKTNEDWKKKSGEHKRKN